MLIELARLFLRPRKKGMRLDVKHKRAAAPWPRNPYKREAVPHSDEVLKKLLGFG